jgi:hypothetical protein
MEAIETEELNLLNVARTLELPQKSDGSEYELDDLMDDQKQVMAHILMKLHEWLSYLQVDCCGTIKFFEPLRLTIVGAAGTGKSVLINTIVTTLRRIFELNDVVHIGAPTGTAAFNVGGETLHRTFGVKVETKGMESGDPSPSESIRQALLRKFRVIIAVLIDERSMIGLRTMGSVCVNLKTCAHGGVHSNEDLGGIPIMIMFGDDFQLPPFTRGPFDIVIEAARPERSSGLEDIGTDLFLNISKSVMVLNVSKRQLDNQDVFRQQLQQARTSDIDLDTAEALVHQLSLNRNGVYSREEKEMLLNDSLFISANKAPIAEFNLMRLSQVCSKDHPVALIKANTKTTSKRGVVHIQEDNAPSACLLCVESLVSIAGRNFMPKWGLHNGAIGKVVEIVYAPDTSPLYGDMPMYVVVHFSTYCGPPWDTHNPTVSKQNTQYQSRTPNH